jgi:hypothetical protein
MDMTALFFPQNNDVTVVAKFPGVTTATGLSAKFWVKDDKTTPDSDPTTLSFPGSALTQGSDGLWFSQFLVPASDTATPGAFWWRVDLTDSLNHRTTTGGGPVLVEAV